nr:PepSY domain-containing protein [Nitrospirillum iridis]
MRCAIVAFLLFLPVPSKALSDKEQETARRALRAGEVLSLDHILDRARAEHPGQLLGVHLEEEDGQLVYELRVLGPGGHIGEWLYDARTGAPIKSAHPDTPPSDKDD